MVTAGAVIGATRAHLAVSIKNEARPLELSGLSCGSLVLVNKGSNQGDGGLRVFFHYPMTGLWDHTFFYVTCCKTHDLRHCTAERFFASQRENGGIKLPRRNECTVVDRILVKCCELRKARMHGARTRVQLRVMPPSR